ncbi:hypothetical protein SNE40_011120 [Patella caerulea]|uniref:Uncharacterized protein n=1 Tax=Patella caerulea TaxID=87958 RepID=A0AAN8Q5Z8_PATCE
MLKIPYSSEMACVTTVIAFVFQLLAVWTPHWVHTHEGHILTNYSGLWETCDIYYNKDNISCFTCKYIDIDQHKTQYVFMFHVQLLAVCGLLLMGVVLLLRVTILCACLNVWSYCIRVMVIVTTIFSGLLSLSSAILYAAALRPTSDVTHTITTIKGWSFGLEIIASILCVPAVIITLREFDRSSYQPLNN